MPPDDPRFGTMSGVAVANGVVYGLNRDRGTVWMWESKSGRYLGDWGPGVTVFSHDMEYDPHEGVIWVADRDAHLVKKYSLDGELLMTLGHYEEPGWDEGTSTVRRTSRLRRTAISSWRTATGTNASSSSTKTASTSVRSVPRPCQMAVRAVASHRSQ